MNIWHDINGERIKKDNFVSVIEIQKNGRNKYELDKETGIRIYSSYICRRWRPTRCTCNLSRRNSTTNISRNISNRCIKND